MKLFIPLFTVICLLLGSCQKSDDIKRLLEAEKHVQDNSLYAKELLDTIENPGLYTDKYFAVYIYTSCVLADKLYVNLPPNADIEIAQQWYSTGGDHLRKTQMALFLGRSYCDDEEYAKATDMYIQALAWANEYHLPNEAGYICSYMGDLYTDNDDLFAAIPKYQQAASYFKEANNQKSRAYAYRDIGRSWALIDSLSLALENFTIAKDIAEELGNQFTVASILNGLGNVYNLMGDYTLAEETILQSLRLDTLERIPSLNALTTIYIKQKEFSKARQLLDSIASLPLPEGSDYYLNYKYYLLNADQNNYQEALEYLESVFQTSQENLIRESEVSFHELEKKYNHVKLVSEVRKLRIHQQYFAIGFIIITLFILSGIIITQKRKINSNRIASEQDKTINQLMAKQYHLTHELNNKEANSLKNKNEIEQLNSQLKELRRKRLLTSETGKKLKTLSSTIKPNTNHILITDKMWKSIIKEVKDGYPEFELKIHELCPDISDLDWQYSCLVLFDLDSNEEAVLLNINPDSVRQRRSRVRKRLGISLNNTTLYDYFTNHLTNN